MSPEVFSEIVKWALLAAFLMLVSWLLRQMLQAASQEQRNAYGTGTGESPGGASSESSQGQSQRDGHEEIAEKMREHAERRFRQKQASIDQIRKRNPDLAREVLRQAGFGHLSPSALDNPETLRKVAEQIDDDVLAMLHVASEQPVLDLNLKTTTELERSSAGGVFTTTERLTDLTQLPQAKPTTWALPSQLRDYQIATGQAQRTQFWNLVEEQVFLEILQDGSGSMVDSLLRNGLRRTTWAQGVVVKFAKQAVAGSAFFSHRWFDSNVHDARLVTNSAEAQKFLDWYLHSGPTQGGTDILHALQVGVRSIKKRMEGKNAKGHILLITDGEDGTIEDTSKLKKLLGDVSLHVIVIGASNPYLKEVATSYMEYQ